MSDLLDIQRLAESHGLTFKDCGNGHVQISGHGNLVNYYPFSKRRSLWSPTLNRRETNCTPWDAVRLCMNQAKQGMKPKAKPPRNRPEVDLTPVHTNPAGLRHFYKGDVPPWDESLGDFQLLGTDPIRAAAYELEQDAADLRLEAKLIDEAEAA